MMLMSIHYIDSDPLLAYIAAFLLLVVVLLVSLPRR
jgi:hypothetical protein